MIEKRIILPSLALSIAFIFYCAQIVCGQDDPPIKVNTVLLNVPILVSDKGGTPINGLTKEDFEVTVGGRKQDIDFFADKGPANIAIIIDTNSNTRDVLDKMKRDAQQLLEFLGPEDRAMVVKFDLNYKVVCELTPDRNKLRRAIGGIESNRDRIRIMVSVVHQVVFRELSGVKGKKAVILLADPDSNLPPFVTANRDYVNESPIKNQYENLAAADVTIYPIFYQTTAFPGKYVGKTLTINELVAIPGMDYFNAFALLSGGRFYAAGVSNLKAVLNQIVDEVRNQYLLSFYIDRDSGNKDNQISVKAILPGAVTRTKRSIRAIPAGDIQKSISELSSLRNP